MTPKRIQRKRTAGWRMPKGAVYVGRPAGWGSPFRAGEPYRFNNINGSTLIGIVPRDRERLAYLFDQYINTRRDLWPQIRAELCGKDLACWCPLDEPCHADSLLRIANGGDA